MTETATCRSCQAPVIWVVTTNGKRMPLDAEPSFKGNVKLDDLNVAHFGKNGDHLDGPRYLSHFATCRDAPRHRRK